MKCKWIVLHENTSKNCVAVYSYSRSEYISNSILYINFVFRWCDDESCRNVPFKLMPCLLYIDHELYSNENVCAIFFLLESKQNIINTTITKRNK